MKAVSWGCRGGSLSTIKTRKKNTGSWLRFFHPGQTRSLFLWLFFGWETKLKAKLHDTNKLRKSLFLRPVEKRTKRKKCKCLTARTLCFYLFLHSFLQSGFADLQAAISSSVITQEGVFLVPMFVTKCSLDDIYVESRLPIFLSFCSSVSSGDRCFLISCVISWRLACPFLQRNSRIFWM